MKQNVKINVINFTYLSSTFAYKEKQLSEKSIVKLIRLNSHNHINSEFDTTSRMSNQKRAFRNRQKFVYYFNIFFETTHAYQMSDFFVEQANEVFNIFVFDTRLDRIARTLNTRSQIVQERFQQSKASVFLKFLLEHDIDDFDKKENGKDMKSQQEDEIENSHTFTRQIERQITSFATKSQRQFRHTHSHKRFIIKFQSTTQQAIIIVEKTMKLFFRLIDKNVEFLISLMMKDIDEFKKSVIERLAD